MNPLSRHRNALGTPSDYCYSTVEAQTHSICLDSYCACQNVATYHGLSKGAVGQEG